jgi:hypothetical protein
MSQKFPNMNASLEKTAARVPLATRYRPAAAAARELPRRFEAPEGVHGVFG